MNATQIVLNVAVNLGRLSRFSTEGRLGRIEQFLKETEEFLIQLDSIKVSEKFKPTLDSFKAELKDLKNKPVTKYDWADKTLTWANILQHRAKLA